jgi:arylsulfatase A-like enzyme
MKDKPNIVMIIVDQWRGDCAGILGNPFVDTPNLDRIFSKGTVFTQAYSAVPSCIAARASLLTGMAPENHGRVGYQDRVPWNYVNTLPGKLAEAGYHTHCVGKMHVFPARNLMGFHSVELHDGYLHNERCRNTGHEQMDDYLPWLREKCGADADITDAGVGCNGYSVSPWPYEERYHPTNWVTSRSIDFLRRRDPGKPFFLKVSYHRPHPPLDPPKNYLDRYLDRELPPLPIGDWVDPDQKIGERNIDSPVPVDEKQIDLARRAYYAQLTHIDCQLNRLIHALNEASVLNNTLILFVSDHGDMLYDHRRVAKSLPYSASARIPLMIKLPDSWKAAAAENTDVPVELRDIMPTLLEAAGSDIPETVDGISLLPYCQGRKKCDREYIHGEHSSGDNSNHWITDGREMYVWYSQTGEEQLFDIRKDPCNVKNLVRKKPGRVEYLRNCLIKELTSREENYVIDGKLAVGVKPKSILSFLEKKD